MFSGEQTAWNYDTGDFGGGRYISNESPPVISAIIPKAQAVRYSDP